MKRIDLHLHTNHSDGRLSPKDLVQLTAQADISAIAVTDHDTVSGIPEALAAAPQYGIEIIPGIEMSVVHGTTPLHLLGYWMDTENRDLSLLIQQIQEARHVRNNAILENLNKIGIELDLSFIQGFDRSSGAHQIGRPHIAKALVEQKIVKTIHQAFQIYLRRGGSAYAERKIIPAEEAVATIRSAGGMPVLAHPASIDQSLKSIPGLLTDLKDAGLSGVEAYYSGYPLKTIKKLVSMAEELDLWVSGGSDFHGMNHSPKNYLKELNGVHVPYSLLDRMKQSLFQQDRSLSSP